MENQSQQDLHEDVPGRELRDELNASTKELYAVMAAINARRYPNGPHELPPDDYNKAIGVITLLQRRYGLPFILMENSVTRINTITEPSERLLLPRIQTLRSKAQILAKMRRNMQEDQEYRQILSDLAKEGIYFAILLSDRKSAGIYFSQDPNNLMTHDEIREALIVQNKYNTSFPCVSGMLVKRNDGGFTLITDEVTMIWPEHVIPSSRKTGKVPTISVGVFDVTKNQLKDTLTYALVGTKDGHIIYAEEHKRFRREREDAYKRWIVQSLYK